MHVTFKFLCVILAGAITTIQFNVVNREKQSVVDVRTEPEKFKDRLNILKKRCKGWI